MPKQTIHQGSACHETRAHGPPNLSARVSIKNPGEQPSSRDRKNSPASGMIGERFVPEHPDLLLSKWPEIARSPTESSLPKQAQWQCKEAAADFLGATPRAKSADPAHPPVASIWPINQDPLEKGWSRLSCPHPHTRNELRACRRLPLRCARRPVRHLKWRTQWSGSS